MLYIFVFLLIGIGATVYGVREQKTQYSEQHFAEAEVVGHQGVRSHNLSMTAMNAAIGNVNPVVGVQLPDGMRKVVPLHTQIPRSALSHYPELDVGGKVSVTFYGDDPTEVFLTGHPMAQTPVKCSTVLLIGIVFLLIALGLLVVGIFTSFQ